MTVFLLNVPGTVRHRLCFNDCFLAATSCSGDTLFSVMTVSLSVAGKVREKLFL